MNNFGSNIDKKKYDTAIQWDITHSCNFSCYQCAAMAKLLEGESAPEKIKIKALKKYLNKSKRVINFIFSGGEPLCVDNILEVFIEVTNKHYISLNTNLISTKINKIAKFIDPGRVIFINASAHILELKKRKLLNTFISHALLLKKRNFNITVTEIAYPFFVTKVKEYKKLFFKYGIDLYFHAFNGEWKKKKYPDSYTEQEIKTFNLDINPNFGVNKYLNKVELCNAGYNVVVAKNDGRVYPCYFINKELGNIYKNIHFNKNLIKCPFDSCSCPLSVYENKLFQKALLETKRKNKTE